MTSIEFCFQLLSLEHSLLKFAYRFNLNRSDAKDLVQETYLKALLNREKYDNQNFKSWTMTIMKNTFIDNYRKTTRKKILHIPIDEFLFFNRAEFVTTENPCSTYSAKEISQKIEQLHDKFKTPFKMYISGYKYSEIAENLDLNIGTVKNRIFLSRKQLMAQLDS